MPCAVRTFIEYPDALVQIWSHVFGKDHLNIDVRGRSLVVTEAPFTPDPLRKDMDEVYMSVPCARGFSSFCTSFEGSI